MDYFPVLNSQSVEVLRSLRIIFENIQQNPLYLQSKKCNYDPEVILLLCNLITLNVSSENDNTENNEINLREECQSLIKELKMLKTNGGKGMSTSEQISIYKMLISQLDKVREIDEAAEQIAHYQRFKHELFNILERYLSPAQISEFIEEFNESIADRS